MLGAANLERIPHPCLLWPSSPKGTAASAKGNLTGAFYPLALLSCCQGEMTAWPFVSKMHFNGLLSPSPRSPPGDPIKTEETLSSVAFAGQQYAWTTSEHAGNAFFHTSWQASSLPEDRPSDFTTLQRPCPSGHKETVLEETSPVSIPQYRLDPEQPLGLTASEPHWHCGEERKLSKPNKQPSWMTFSFENRAPGGELLIAGSRAECQQAFSQKVESHSCLLCIKKRKKEKNVITLYESLQKWKKCNRLVTLSLSPSELSEESKSDLHSNQKAIPRYLEDLICLRVESSQVGFN